MNREKILEIKNLKQYFHLDKSTTVKAVDDISFDIYKGEIFGLVGESGSGKSTTGKTIIRLHESTGGEVIYKGNIVRLAPKELELFHFMASNPNKVFTREQLMFEVWGYDYPGDSRTVDVHVKRLREKIKGGKEWELQTVWGVGYKFEVR